METGKKTNDLNNSQMVIMCDCYSHGLVVERLTDESEVYISVFERGLVGRKMDWRQKLRWIYHIVFKGHPYTDQFILDKQKQQQLAEFLLQK